MWQASDHVFIHMTRGWRSKLQTRETKTKEGVKPSDVENFRLTTGHERNKRLTGVVEQLDREAGTYGLNTLRLCTWDGD